MPEECIPRDVPAPPQLPARNDPTTDQGPDCSFFDLEQGGKILDEEEVRQAQVSKNGIFSSIVHIVVLSRLELNSTYKYTYGNSLKAESRFRASVPLHILEG